MKKILVALTIVAILAIVPSAMARGVKAPKNLCLQFDSWPDTHFLVIKSLGSIPTPTGKENMYSIAGKRGDIPFPISGSAFAIPGTTTLHASYGGSYGITDYRIVSFELVYDLENEAGNIYFRYEDATGLTIFNNQDTVTGVDCK